MAKKLTKRKAVNFLRSYYDVLNEIPKEEDKLNFLLSVLDKLFTDKDPEGLNFIVNLSYESQRHSVEKSVKGYKDKTKTDLLGNPLKQRDSEPNKDPCQGGGKGGLQQPCQQEQEKEEEQEKEIYIIYSEETFLNRWKDARLHFDKKPTHIKKLTTFEKINFNKLKSDYGKEEFDQAIQGLFSQDTFPATRLRPTHFLEREHFEKYLTCFHTKEKLFKQNNKKPIDRI